MAGMGQIRQYGPLRLSKHADIGVRCRGAHHVSFKISREFINNIFIIEFIEFFWLVTDVEKKISTLEFHGLIFFFLYLFQVFAAE